MAILLGNVCIFRGGPGDMPRLLAHLQESGVETQGNPDLFVSTNRSFGIEDAHDIAARARTRALRGRRVFAIAASTYTTEAQNALLKTLEEAPGDALFAILAPSPELLLVTVRSRAQLLPLDTGAPVSVSPVDGAAFCNAPPPKRIELLKPLLEKDDDDRYDLAPIMAFLADIERIFAERLAQPASARAARTSLEAIYRARGYLTDRGALVKALLESVALLCE